MAAISILVSLTMLAFYKYAKYYHASPFAIADTATEQPMVEIVVPLGLSFIVFSGISYSIDVYSGESCGTPLDVFTYMFFFPKLISGPIVQWKEFSPQLNKRTFSVEQISVGIDYIIIGLAKKLIIADVFGAQISFINETAATTGIDIQTVWLRSLLFFFQLYYDFSGYSDIAIGLSRIFGFSIRQNFNYPYLSTSVSEFWRRWHISLGAWFRRYVYIPLGGSRNGNVYVNLFIVFLLTGIWHGDDWTYVLWGVINGIAVVIERALKDTRFYQKIPKLIKWGFTVLFVYFAWVLFMSNDIGEALTTYAAMFTPVHNTINFTWRFFFTRRILLLIVIGGLGSIGGFRGIYCFLKTKIENTTYMMIKKSVMIMLFFIDMLFLVNSSYSPFIYFQF